MNDEQLVYEFMPDKDNFVKISMKDIEPVDVEHADLNEGIDKLKNWSLQGIWNDESNFLAKRAPKKRDYITFGDLGKRDMWSRYMKTNGVEETNPISPRGMRAFAMGNIVHDLLKSVLKRTGLLINTQDEPDEFGNNQWSIISETDKTLKLLGKYDALCGGELTEERYKKAKYEIFNSDLPDYFKNKSTAFLDYFFEKNGGKFKKLLYDFKSINSMAFWSKRNYLLQANKHHQLQLYGYLKANYKQTGCDEGRLLYFSKDDAVMAEFPIHYPDSNLEKLFNNDVETFSNYILNKTEPPKPELTMFDERKVLSFQRNKKTLRLKGCYVPNWEVRYSSFMTLMHGFKTEKEFMKSAGEEMRKKNEELKLRYVEILKKKNPEFFIKEEKKK